MDEPVDWPTRDLASHRAATTPDRTALIDTDGGEAWTYREFDRRVDRAAEGLVESTSGAGDRRNGRVGFLLDTGVAFATAFFAAMRLGTAVAPLSVRETPPEIAAKADRLDLDAVVCEPETESSAVDALDCPAITVGEPEHRSVSPLFRSADSPPPLPADSSPSPSVDPSPARSPVSSAVEPVELGRDEVQVIAFTSGTSGEPKAVRLTVGNLVASATASAFRLGVLPEDRWLCCLPMYHVGGLAPVVRSVLYGTTVVIQRTFDPEGTARAMAEREITGVSLVPTACERLLDAGWSPPDSLRFVLLGGAPASRELLERCERRGVPVHPTYGTTETASQIATARPDEAFSHPGTVGQPLEFTSIAVVDADGDPVDDGESGELVVSGPTVTPGYLDDDRTESAFGDRGLHTGDVGYRDADGRLWIRGRRDDRIVTGGENVDPDEVRKALRGHPAVADAAVVGLSDSEWGERVAALIVPVEPAESPDPESLLERCRERLAGFKCPRTIGFADELPTTPSGTVDREAVRKRLRASGDDVR